MIILDHTVRFTEKWIKSWKLKEQMDGAARSGKQNVVEGCDGMETSLKTGIKLCGVAKHSTEELIGDLEDFLRQRSLEKWGKQDRRVRNFRNQSSKLIGILSRLGKEGKEDKAWSIISRIKMPEKPESAANWLLTICHQQTFLLHRQVISLKNKHEKEGGLTEELYRKRKNYRDKNKK
ncbi:MAG: four helix bundle suffix domain-containing protein [Candidatus Moranbacteria bacterium]|nr:four helix bundle suffix domain-containing protein [Candidatus Moranbacteria bacterium]